MTSTTLIVVLVGYGALALVGYAIGFSQGRKSMKLKVSHLMKHPYIHYSTPSLKSKMQWRIYKQKLS